MVEAPIAKNPASKILIVDDEKFNCKVVQAYLMTLGIKEAKKKVKAVFDG